MADPIPIDTLSAAYPLVLLPVRLETRFDHARATLLIRIYPDEIFADTHEPQLTEAEEAAGIEYWGTIWKADEAVERSAWGRLVARSTATRAAWIVEATTPTNSRVTEDKPEFPLIPRKAASWTRPALARLLPERWVVVASRAGIERHRVVSNPVQPALQLSLSPDEETPRVELGGPGGPPIDVDLLWTVDFGVALTAGMAVEITPLSADDLTLGFDRIIAIGVVTQALPTPVHRAQALGALLDAHHYTRGLAFVPQGAPTNNTRSAPAAYPTPDPGGAQSFVVERGTSLPTAGSDGTRWAAALGIDVRHVAHVEGADRTENVAARAMANALWPATWGYFIEQMMAPLFEPRHVAQVRRYFVEHVQARGPYPSFRVGDVPYGLLPVTTLGTFTSSQHATGDVEKGLPAFLAGLFPHWRNRTSGAPRIGRTTDPDADLLEVLGMDASASEFRVRGTMGATLILNLFRVIFEEEGDWRLEYDKWRAHASGISATALKTIGKDPAWADARAAWLVYEYDAPRFGAPFVQAGVLSETDPLTTNYIATIREATIQELRDMSLPADAPLLQRILRHATLWEYARLCYDTLFAAGELRLPWDRYEREFREMPWITPSASIWELFAKPLPMIPGAPLVADYLLSPHFSGTPEGLAVASYRASLKELEARSTAELERLFTETLDTSSYRLDAWVTSVAKFRLEEMARARAHLPAAGTNLGAFGWVENLRPAIPSDVVQGGHVHAPTLTHAAAAAVLRNAHLTRAGTAGQQYALHLSSSRVRTARALLDAVRNGQPLGAVLGYRIERRLHELGRQWLIAGLRGAFPLVAEKRGGATGEPLETIAARNVADGLALVRAWLAAGKNVDALKLMPRDAADKAALTAEIGALEEAMDAVADLLTAESVFQIVRGNTTAAAASMDALAQGLRPPDPEIVRAPRSGPSFTHRVAIALDRSTPPSAWATTVRSTLEPRVNAWAGAIFGDLSAVACSVSVPGAAAEDPRRSIDVTLENLDLSPLDLVALADAGGAESTDSDFDRRVAFAALGDEIATDVQITYDRTTSGAPAKTFREVIELARMIAVVLRSARPLRPADLSLPERGSSSAQLDDGDATTRAKTLRGVFVKKAAQLQAAITAARTALTDASEKDLRAALREVAAFGLSGVFPAPRGQDGGKALLAAAGSVMTEVNRRDGAQAKVEIADTATAMLVVRAILGEGALFVPRFTLPDASSLKSAFSEGPDLLGATKATAIGKWMMGASRVRPALGRWRKLWLVAEALGASRASYSLAQIPHQSDVHWAALPPPSSDLAAAISGVVSLVMHGSVPTGSTWAGLLLDEWAEVIPAQTQSTGVAFHYDNPGAEAPQVALALAHPDGGFLGKKWSLATALAILNDTIDLSHMRAVDGELLGELAQLLPAVFFADDHEAKVTISTALRNSLLDERTIGAP